MARKKSDDKVTPTELAGDKTTPDKRAKRPRPQPNPDVVKVAGGRVVKTPASKAPQKPSAARKNKAATKPAASVPTAEKPPRKRGKATGTTAVEKTVKLNTKELEALQAGHLHGLDERQAKFIDLWLVTQNGTQSYLDAGFTCKSDAVAAAAASRLLRKVKEHPYTLAKRAELFAKTEEITNRVIERVYGAALADPRELVEYVYKCCRRCHGKDFRYQMTPSQMEERKQRHDQAVAEAKHARRKAPVFDELGGLGFDATRDPHPECPECNGRGEGQLVLKDTRYLSPGALALYGGVKETKDGLEVKIADQRPYLELLGRIFNMNIEPAPPIVAAVSKEQLDEVYKRGLEQTQAQREAMAGRAAQIAALNDGGDE